MSNTIHTKIHYYDFDIKEHEDRVKWGELFNMLRHDLGLKPHVFNTEVNRVDWKKIVHDNRTEDLYLETDYIFDNQWNGNSDTNKNYRFFDWKLYEFPNKDFKTGYWIEPTYETMDIRGQFQCRYCGKLMGYGFGDGFHHECLGSRYLKANEIEITSLCRVYEKWAKNRKPVKIPGHIWKEYTKRQAQTWSNIASKKHITSIENAKEKAEKAIISANIGLEVSNFLIDHDLFDHVDNFIYYNHSNTVTFGWMSSAKYPKEKAEELRNSLEKNKFPFKFSIETYQE